MKLKPVEYLPERCRVEKKNLDEFFKMFMKMNVKYALIQFHDYEYITGAACRGSLNCHLENHPGLPIEVRTVCGQVYLVRTDMED